MGSLFGATATGLAIGAFLLAPLADKFGRRLIMLIATGAIAIAMLATARAETVPELAALRFVTGAGLGTLSVCLNVMVAEFSNERWRNPLVALLHTGFSIGTMVGGGFAALLLGPYGWQGMFISTGILNVITFLLVLFVVPESPSFLIMRGNARALGDVNRILGKIGHAPIDALPPVAATTAKAKLAALFSDGRVNATLLLWVAQFSFSVISYLVLNWKPTVLVNAGLTPQQAGIAGLVSGFMGILGHTVVGFLSSKGREALLTTIFFLMLCVSLLLFGLMPAHPPWGLILSAGLTSFCNVGCLTGLLLIAINYYPASVRTTSVALMLGIARIGAITGPMFGGLLLELGYPRSTMFIVLAGMSLAPIIAIFFILRLAKPARATAPAL
jgi:MFS family permease